MRKITLKTVILFCVSILFSTGAFAQYDATVKIDPAGTTDVTQGLYKNLGAVITALNTATGPLGAASSVLVTVDNGIYTNVYNWNLGTAALTRDIKIVVKGSSNLTDSTLLKTPYLVAGSTGTNVWGSDVVNYKRGKGGVRFTSLEGNPGAGVDITFDGLTFAWFGQGGTTSCGFLSTAYGSSTQFFSGPVKFTFKNCNFHHIISRLGAIVRMDKETEDKVEISFDNCSFTNIGSFYCGAIGAPFYVANGKLSITNCSFYTNFQDPLNWPNVSSSVDNTPGPDADKKMGSILHIQPQFQVNSGGTVIGNGGNPQVVFSNNKIINTQILDAVTPANGYIKPVISVLPGLGAASNKTVSLTMENNLIIGNHRTGEGHSEDVDILFADTATVSITAAGNIVNAARIVKWNAEKSVYEYRKVYQTEMEGFKIDASYTYNDSRIAFTAMNSDQSLPAIVRDATGVNNLSAYTGNGGTPNPGPSGFNSLSSANLKIYPNPSKGQFKLTIQDNQQNSAYEIINMAGTMIKFDQFTGKSAVINLTNTPKGLYLIKVTNDNGTSTSRIVLE